MASLSYERPRSPAIFQRVSRCARRFAFILLAVYLFALCTYVVVWISIVRAGQDKVWWGLDELNICFQPTQYHFLQGQDWAKRIFEPAHQFDAKFVHSGLWSNPSESLVLPTDD